MRFGHFFYPMNFDTSRDYQAIEIPRPIEPAIRIRAEMRLYPAIKFSPFTM